MSARSYANQRDRAVIKAPTAQRIRRFDWVFQQAC